MFVFVVFVLIDSSRSYNKYSTRFSIWEYHPDGPVKENRHSGSRNKGNSSMLIQVNYNKGLRGRWEDVKEDIL